MATLSDFSIAVHARHQDAEQIKQLEDLLSATTNHPKLVDVNGREIPLPDAVYEALKSMVQAMAAGRAIRLVPTDYELTTQEAAEILNVSRPYLIKILNQGEIPYVTVGRNRRIRVQDLMQYKQKRDATRRQNLNNLTEFLQEEGFYGYDGESSDCI